jgi:hypothetical protein
VANIPNCISGLSLLDTFSSALSLLCSCKEGGGSITRLSSDTGVCVHEGESAWRTFLNGCVMALAVLLKPLLTVFLSKEDRCEDLHEDWSDNVEDCWDHRLVISHLI